MDAGDARRPLDGFSLPHAGDEDNERRADLRRGSGARGRGARNLVDGAFSLCLLAVQERDSRTHVRRRCDRKETTDPKGDWGWRTPRGEGEPACEWLASRRGKRRYGFRAEKRSAGCCEQLLLRRLPGCTWIARCRFAVRCTSLPAAVQEMQPYRSSARGVEG
jgi:hypothetical protein